MKFTILTLFPDFFTSCIDSSILKRAQLLPVNPVEFTLINIRNFASDKHRTTDDRPYGGGAGMVLKVDPIDAALTHVKQASTADPGAQRTVLTSAKGGLFTQKKAQSFSTLSELIIICGHYEGVDQRVADHLVDEEIRIGDYVLTGGESAALVIVDAVTRLLPGVLGNHDSSQDESHQTQGVLEYPQYTRPQMYNQWSVPDILLGGDHKQIEAWKEKHRTKTEPSE